MVFNHVTFNQYLEEKKLMGCRCRKCGLLYLPPRPFCGSCLGQEMEWVELTGKGKLAAFTIITVSPTFMVAQGYGRDNPYCVGIVELEEGPKISARILAVEPQQPETIKVGTPMVAEFIKLEAEDMNSNVLAFKPSP
jgi:uncharacterized OB-fold protein